MIFALLVAFVTVTSWAIRPLVTVTRHAPSQPNPTTIKSAPANCTACRAGDCDDCSDAGLHSYPYRCMCAADGHKRFQPTRFDGWYEIVPDDSGEPPTMIEIWASFAWWQALINSRSLATPEWCL